MAAQPVEWVLVVYYNSEAHRATYGRKVKSKKYTKDFIQLPPTDHKLIEIASRLLARAGDSKSVPVNYQWPLGTALGHFVFISSDRPHLKWETNQGTPQVWKMSPAPNESTAETIPGDPSHTDFDAAENERTSLASRGAGQPYLIVVKLRDEPSALHLRAYLSGASQEYGWADLALVPPDVQALALKTRQTRALKWSTFESGGVPPIAVVKDALARLAESPDPTLVIDELDPRTCHTVADYLRQPGYGLFFDPSKNHDAWLQPASIPEQIADSVEQVIAALESRTSLPLGEDATAESSEVDPDEVEAFRQQIGSRNFEVPDSTATVKTRGSAQRAFADTVKANYGYQCAITGIATRAFLVEAHIVPWSEDASVRLDPSNGICLSSLVDRAFETGYLVIHDDQTVSINWKRVGDDQSLRSQLEPYDGRKLALPTKDKPQTDYLGKRRAMFAKEPYSEGL